VEVQVRGFTFTHRLLNDAEFERTHEGSQHTEAITLWHTKRVDYKASKLSIENVRHEVAHMYMYCSLSETAELTPLQVEEIMAETFGYFGPEMLKVADLIYKKLS
jgi:hypothetical protein